MPANLTTEQIDATKALSAGVHRVFAAFEKSRETTPKMYHAILELDRRIESFLANPADPHSLLDGLRLVHQKFGAPGDWGYGTLRGDGLRDFYKINWPNWTKCFPCLKSKTQENEHAS